MRIDRIALVLAPLAAINCAKVSVVGTSGEPDDAHVSSGAPDASQVPSGEVDKPEHKGPKYTSTITPPAGNMMLGFDQPILGDVDGDGLDDFLVLGSMVPHDAPTPEAVAAGLSPQGIHPQVFLFYGKPQLAMNLSTNDADADFDLVFDDYALGVWPVGDVNGDGLADFSIGRRQGLELMFGSTTRYSGSLRDIGLLLVGARLPSPVSPDVAPLDAMRGAGDIDGDGIDDLIITATTFEPQSQIESSNGFGLINTDYLVLGRHGIGEWGGEMWDPSSAVASFGIADVVDANGSHHRRKLSTLAAGDLDGDGVDDILAQGANSVYVFYGGPGKLTGTLDPSNADASFVDVIQPKPAFAIDYQAHTLFAIGDLDGDGASDLALVGDDSLTVTYGSKSRWSGATQLTPDYVIDFSSQDRMRLFPAAQSGDIDGDGAPELVVMTQSIPPDSPIQDGTVLMDTLYVFHGTPGRALGMHHADASDVHPLATDHTATLPITASPLSQGQPGTMLSLAGDIDGDGSCDIVTGHPGGLNEQVPQPEVYVIPSTPNDPD